MTAAEILVECGYADGINEDHVMIAYQTMPYGDIEFSEQPIEYDQDTLEGRRQADAIEDWLRKYHEDMWQLSGHSKTGANTGIGASMHKWRLDRIKWCMENIND